MRILIKKYKEFLWGLPRSSLEISSRTFVETYDCCETTQVKASDNNKIYDPKFFSWSSELICGH